MKPSAKKRIQRSRAKFYRMSDRNSVRRVCAYYAYLRSFTTKVINSEIFRFLQTKERLKNDQLV